MTKAYTQEKKNEERSTKQDVYRYETKKDQKVAPQFGVNFFGLGKPEEF